MNLEDLLYSILGNLPVNVKVEFPMPDLSGIQDLIPTQVELGSMMKYLVIFAAASLLLGLVGRAALGKRSDLNHALSSVMGILLVYVLTIVIYTFRPWELDKLLSPLPFVVFAGEYMSLFSFQTASIGIICYEILAMLILSFLVNLFDTFIPQGETAVSWYLLRFLTVIIAMGAHLLARWALTTYLPDVLVTYAPMILLGILAVLLLLGVLKMILGLVLTAVNPILGAIYAFFFSNIIGKQLTKAVLSTAILCALVYLLEYVGIFLVSITQEALLAYIPALVILLVLWYLIGHIL